jgi:hypothetical protein
MKPYRKLDLVKDFKIIQTKTLEYLGDVKSGFTLLDWADFTAYCPEVLTCCEAYGLTPIAGAIYVIQTQEDEILHIDYADSKNWPKARINIPILNCEGSKTQWFRGGQHQIVKLKSRTPWVRIEGDVEKIDEVEVTQPIVHATQIAHLVKPNLERIPRIMLTLRMDRDPVYLLKEEF